MKSSIREDIEAEEEHIIARSRDVDKLKGICKFDVANDYDDKPAEFEEKHVFVVVENENLNLLDDEPVFRFGSTCVDKKQVYRVLEEIYGVKILLNDWSRPVKRMFGERFGFWVCQPVNGMYPLIVLNPDVGGFHYIVAPFLENSEE